VLAALLVGGEDLVGFDSDGNCPAGHTLCLPTEPVTTLGGVPRLSGEQPPQSAGASACAFTSEPAVNGTFYFLYFANTQYSNLQIFKSFNGISWAHSRDIPLPCPPRGLAIDETAVDPYALFACTEAGEVYSVDLASGVSSLLSSGIDFSPGYARAFSKYSDLPRGSIPGQTTGGEENLTAATTNVQCDATSSLLSVGIVHSSDRKKAWLTNRNWDEVLEIDLFNNASSPPQVCADSRNPCIIYGATADQTDRPPAAFCLGQCVLQHHCCNYRSALRSAALRMPVGGSLSPDGTVMAVGSGFPTGKVYLLDMSGANPVLVGDVPAGINGSIAGVNTPVFHPDGKSLYMASRDDGWLAKVALGTGGVPMSTRVVRKELERPKAICLSPDGKFLGMGMSASSSVLGSASCNFVTACDGCSFAPPGNSSFGVVNTCDWFCNAGRYWVPLGGQIADATPSIYSTASWLSYTSPGLCTTCPEGRYAPPATITPGLGAVCLPCPGGTFGTLPGQEVLASCASCKEGFFSAEASVSCTACASGTYGADGAGVETCSYCPAGTASPNPAATNATSCVSCPLGSAGNTSGLAACALCEAGTYQNVTGATACVDCASGRWSTPGNETCHLDAM